jgi:malate dehydrogenase (oxaloacetate-decarboxylating)(NADP+)
MKKTFNKIAEKLHHLLGGHGKTHQGYDILHNSAVNKSTAFTPEERDALGIRGLLPHHVSTQDGQKAHVLEQLHRKSSDIEKYIYLAALQERNERLFYYTALENITEIMPLIYTPTVGEACKEFSQIFRTPRGLYITPDDKGKIRAMLDNWTEDDVRAIVITDGQRILGLGDLGANGMGIPIGKLALYTICGGVDPAQCLPVMFDVGTNNDPLRNDPLYLGYPHRRLEGPAYFELMEEFVAAVNDKFPKAMIQFEDFLTPNALKLLEIYRDKTLCFNDDVQGTAAVILAGVYAAAKAKGEDFKDQTIMFLGAGSASTGIADLIVKALEDAGLSEAEARSRIWLVDSKGLITQDRPNLEPHKVPYAQNHVPMKLLEAIKDVKPTMLIGATGAPGTFTQEIVEAMSEINERPVIFALSNPTSHSECTAKEAYEWSRGKALFACGSPFDAVEYEGQIFRPGQGNNAYIFPGLAQGVISSDARRVTEEMFLVAAKTLASLVTEEDFKSGTLYPPLKDIRNVSAKIAAAVAKTAAAQGLTRNKLPADLESFMLKRMYDPSYPPPVLKPSRKPGVAPG